MRKVKFTNMPRQHLQVIQNELLNYAQGFTEHLKRPDMHTDFIYSVTQVDIANALWRKFRTKIESGVLNLRFSVSASEATIILHACSNASVIAIDPYVANVGEMYKNQIDHQLKSYNTVFLIQQ